MITLRYPCLVCLATLWQASSAVAGTDVPLSQQPAPSVGAYRSDANSLSADARLVTYEYDPNRSYPVKTRAHSFTELAVPESEHIVSWFPSADEKRGWPYIVSGDKRHIFIMPMQAGGSNSATLITDKRSYLLTFESAVSGVWYQRVRWSVPEDGIATLPDMYDDAGHEAAGNDSTAATPASDSADAPDTPALENLFVNYEISGKADFSPTLVADDGRFTWFRLPPGIQELPALFVLDPDDKPELVNYTVDQNQTIKAQRTANAWLLKLGDDEVRVRLKSDKTNGRHSWWFN